MQRLRCDLSVLLRQARLTPHALPFLQGIAGFSSPEIPDPLAGTYPDPPLHDPTNARMDALISRLKEERAAALAAALAAHAP